MANSMALHHAHASPLGHKPHTSSPDVLIEFAEHVHKSLDTGHQVAGYLNKTAKFYYGHQAFREYRWLKGLPVMNKAGNLRGMVLDKRARAIFTFTIETGEKLEKLNKVLLLAQWLIEFAKIRHDIIATVNSSADPSAKLQRICVDVSLAIFRPLVSTVPAATHAVAVILLKGAHRFHLPAALEAKIRSDDMLVDSVYKKITNSDDVIHYINTTVTERIWRYAPD